MRSVFLLPLGFALAACAVQPAPMAGGLPKYTIFFTEWSGRIDDAAAGTIAAAAAAAKASPFAPVKVIGYADPTGSPEANHDVSQLRAQMVQDQLVADGVIAARITRAGFGATSYTESSQESRRVEISVGTP